MEFNTSDSGTATDILLDSTVCQTQGDLSRSIFDDMRTSPRDTQVRQDEAATSGFIDFAANDPFTTNDITPSASEIKALDSTESKQAILSADTADEKIDRHPEQWGKRQVEVHNDGSATYTVEKGDTLWSISRDVLKSEHSNDPAYHPTNAEIQRTVKEIARRNGIENPDLIDVAQKLELKPRTEPIITRDDSGRVTGLDYPNGRPAHSFVYDLDGNLTGVHDSDGLHWRQQDGKWNQFDDHGRAINSADTIQVNASGDMAVGFNDGEIVIDHLGRGSMMMKDTDGRPTEIYYPDGRPSNTIAYDETGNPTRIRNDEGFEWQKLPSGWEHRNPRGETISSADLIEVTPQGDIVWKSNDGSQVVLSRDGSTSMN